MNNKEKIIAEFRIQEINFKEQFLDEYFHCLLCGCQLEYSQKTDYIYQYVEEKAQCPNCKIETHQTCHKLQ